jgi:hypothetical protein
MNGRAKLLWAAALLVAVRSEAATHVSNLAESLGFELTADGTHFAGASSFTTGGGATQLTSITVSVFTNTTGTSELRLRADNAGVPGTLIESLGSQTLPSNHGNVRRVFDSAGQPTLAANTTYWVTLGETGSGDFSWDGTFSLSESSPASWTIGNQAKSRANGGSTWDEVFGTGTQERQSVLQRGGRLGHEPRRARRRARDERLPAALERLRRQGAAARETARAIGRRCPGARMPPVPRSWVPGATSSVRAACCARIPIATSMSWIAPRPSRPAPPR